MDTKQIVTKAQGKIILRVVWITHIPTLYGFYRQHYHLGILPFITFCSTYLYWHNPRNDWRRWMDMVIVNVAFAYQNYQSLFMTTRNAYWFWFLSAFSSYWLGWMAYKRGFIWSSVYIHSLLHIFGSIGCCVLYSGDYLE